MCSDKVCFRLPSTKAHARLPRHFFKQKRNYSAHRHPEAATQVLPKDHERDSRRASSGLRMTG